MVSMENGKNISTSFSDALLPDALEGSHSTVKPGKSLNTKLTLINIDFCKCDLRHQILCGSLLESPSWKFLLLSQTYPVRSEAVTDLAIPVLAKYICDSDAHCWLQTTNSSTVELKECSYILLVMEEYTDQDRSKHDK